MKLPPLTHLQFAIIECLGARERSGQEIRDKLAKDYKIRKSLAAFYTLMKRLEDGGLVEGRYEVVNIEGYAAKKRHYKVLGKGRRAWDATLVWYSTREWHTAPVVGGAS